MGSARERREEQEQKKAMLAEKNRRAALTSEQRAVEDYERKYPNGAPPLQEIIMGPVKGSPSWVEKEVVKRKPDAEYESLWSEVTRWRKEVGSTYEQRMSSQIVRMAAGGVQVGSGTWNRNLERVDAKYRTDLADIESGGTYGMLKEHAKDKGADDMETWLQGEWGGTADEYTPTRYMEREQGIYQQYSKLRGTTATITPSGV